MSFGSGGGFSFGGNNNNTQSTFGGFGSNNNTNSGFGSSNTPGGFGASTNNQSTFGGSTFGSNSGGFGNTNNSSSLFGNKPAASNPFGASTNSGSGGLFGNSTNTGGGFGASTGGFGSNNNTSAFGSNNNNASSSFSFGSMANKPAFGNTTNSTPLFGQGGSGTTSGFGTTNAFGSGTALSNQPVPPSEGTASTPFAPHIEKDGTGPASSAYQSIVFQQPYQKYSFEELRLADYNAGRQFGNNSGQAGGFGSNSFGGFGATNTNTGGFGASNTTGGGLFGNNTTSASTGFGTTTSTTGFGGGGLFGNKPATGGGLFGTQSTASTTGGLFGTSNNTTNTGFGTPSGGGLFGNNQTQNKPSPFGATTTTPSFSFGNNNATQTNAAPSGGLFGNNQQTNQSSGGLFGNNNQQQSGGLFGNNNNQQKPLFGNTTGGFGTPATQNQGGGLFNNSTTQNNTGGLFGNNNQQQNTSTGGGLFGNNTNTSGGLFGGNNANNTAQKTGGLFGTSFGNTNTATNTGGGLFSNSTANQQQQSGGLFNNANNNTTSGFSFGNSASKPATTGLFNNTSTNQSGGLFGNSFNGLGASQNNQQNSQQQQDFRVSSLNDPNPYGQTSIWTGLPVPTPDNSKPIFTPLSASQKLKESQSKPPPSLRLNQSRYMTPPRRPGFGFSYSTYGTPNSAASTPGGGSLSNSMYGNRSFNGSSYGGSIGRSFGKSASVSNLRSQFNVGDNDSVLSPNAFNPSHTRWSGGNMRRLTIDRSIRNDLFSRQSLPALTAPSPDKNVNGTPASNTSQNEPPATEPTKLRKRVSFDKETTGGQNGTLNGDSGALVRTEIDDDTPEPEPRGRPASNGGVAPDVQQARGNELAAVPEDRASDHVSPKKTAVEAKPDPQPGDYWMKPTRAQLSKLPRDKLQEFVGFEVGRKGCGRVTFLGAVDLTAVPLDDLYEKIVEIRLRSVTVYPDASSKPPVGKGLNVPSRISIENSWPRARGQPSSATSGPIFDKHVNRLKKMQGTDFVSYDVASGVWTFKVPHYTRYGLDYDDDDDLSRSQLSLPPDSLNGSQSGNVSAMEVDSGSEENDDSEDDEDDTFAFKQKTVPGGFGKHSVIEDYEMSGANAQELEDGPESDLEEDQSDDTENEVSMAGSFPAPAIIESPFKPVLKASRMGTPGKALISLEGDWAEQLQRTISPRKQNREALRDVQSKVLLDHAFEPIKPRTTKKDQLNTSIDIMNSLFSRHEERMSKGRKAQAGPDFEFPYAKRSKTFDDETELSETDKSWHSSFKPHFTATNGLVFKSNGEGDESDAEWTNEALVVDDRGRNVVALTSLQGNADQSTSSSMDIDSFLADAQVLKIDGIPYLEHKPVPFSQSRARLPQKTTTQTELDIYELGHVLFDDYEDEFSRGLSRQQQQEYASKIRKDRLSKYLSSLIWRRHGDQIKASEKSSSAEAAILHLTAKNIKAACDVLMQENNFHLTLLVAQIASPDNTVQQDITEQLNAWREQGVISEISEEIRALYEILAGNTGVCQGKQNVPTENRASTFSISEKFNLDWIQAFALSLWYGHHKSGSVQDSVKEFQEMLISEEETVSPMDARGNEDPLWVLLKVFATQKKGNVSGLEKPVFPQALSILATPWTSKVIFRLHHAIVSSVPGVKVDQDKAEELAESLSFEFGAHENVAGAVYALLHIRHPLLRTKHIKDLLNKHAAILSEPSKNVSGTQSQKSLFDTLEQTLKIPSTWLYAAKALHARSANNSAAELSYQILADDLPSAHETLLRRVAPRLVIDEDWAELSAILKQFGETPEEYIGAVAWSEGGGVFEAFVKLMELECSSKQANLHQQAVKAERAALLQSLQKTLASLNAKDTHRGPLGKDKEKLEERVALREMGRTVAAILKQDADGERSLLEKKSILDLPLTADARLSHATTLGVDYYRSVMAMAR